MSATLALVVLVVAVRAQAQSVVIGAGVQFDVQRFEQEDVSNRLDGSATGWTLLGRFLPLPHVAVTIEWSDAGTIEDVREATFAIDGRTVTVHSALAHRTRGLNLLGGYAHDLTPRIAVSYLAGVAVANVRRTFTTDAPRVVLLPPSDPSAPVSSTTSDRFAAPTGGVDVVIRVRDRLSALAGVRAQRLSLETDLAGWSVRPLAGVGWSF